MKGLLRSLIINAAVIFLTAYIFPGLSYSGNTTVLVLAAIALALVNMFVRPIIKIVTLPLNFLTLGLFSWVINVLMLYIVAQLIPGFSIHSFDFGGYSQYGFVIPAMHISLLMAFIIASFFISLFTSAVSWLFN